MQNDDYQIIIEPSTKIGNQQKRQFIDLVSLGGQVREDYVRVGLARSLLIGLLLIDDQVVSTCCLKLPLRQYINGVFQLSGSPEEGELYRHELGYIATHPDHENKGLCQLLLQQFISNIPEVPIFATTRKPAMIHILGKHHFLQSGIEFKKDLTLMIRHK